MPIPIIVAIGAHAVFILMRLFLVINSSSLVSFRIIPLILVALAIHVVGIIALAFRKKWSKMYTLFLFGFYLVMNVVQLGTHLKEPEHLGLIWSFFSIGLCFYIFHQFYTEPTVHRYLTN